MRMFLIGLMICSYTMVATTVVAAKGAASIPSGAVGATNAWAAALQERNTARLQSMLAPDARYDRLELVGGNKIRRWTGNVTPGLFLRPVSEVRVVKVRPLGGNDAVGIVSQIVEEGTVREWESWITLRAVSSPGGWQVTHITDIAMEGTFPGQPDGCPETSAKRDESITLYGKLEPGHESMVRVFQTQRDTDAWAFAQGGVAEKQKGCTPAPGYALEDLEVVVQEPTGALRGYHHLGRVNRTSGVGGHGIALYTGADGGALVAGGARVYPLPGGQEYLFLARTWMSEKGEANWRAIHRVDAYRWEGTSFHKVWGFDFGKEGGALSGDTVGRVLWTLNAPTPDGTIRATATGSCNGAANFTWVGNGFKGGKEGVTSGCLGSWWPGGEGAVLGMGEVNLEHLAKKAAKATTADEY